MAKLDGSRQVTLCSAQLVRREPRDRGEVVRLRVIRLELENPAIASDAARLGELYGQLEEALAKIARLYERWSELEALRAQLGKGE